MSSVPTLDEFQLTCREAFAYLADFGFVEVLPPPHRRGDRFQIWFGASDRFVVARGEGYGTGASVSLEHASGVRLALVWLLPPALRTAPLPKHSKELGQLDMIRIDAALLQAHGEPFLRGDLTQFLSMAKPLPPYLCEGDV
jgi:hypothetical protein